MFRHNYLSVNGIVSFPSFTWLYKYKEEYKQGEMWHSAQRAEISEIDRVGYKTKATDNFVEEARKQDNELGLT
jgi:hypothetical protein